MFYLVDQHPLVVLLGQVVLVLPGLLVVLMVQSVLVIHGHLSDQQHLPLLDYQGHLQCKDFLKDCVMSLPKSSK